jgi:hypothetical protein
MLGFHWPPHKDGKHAAMPGTSGWCYGCQRMCGGQDVAGHMLRCTCCEAAAAPEAAPPADPAGAGAGTPDTSGPQPPAEPVPDMPAPATPEPAAGAPRTDPAWPDAPQELALRP